MRHLTHSQIQSALSRGRHVEQLLSPTAINGVTALRWIDLHLSNDQFAIVLYEVFDDGSEDYLDIYSFAPVNPDDDPTPHSFDSLDDALTFAESSYAASRDRYVNQAVIQDEYADYLRNRRDA